MTEGTLSTVSKDAEELQAALDRLRRCIHVALRQHRPPAPKVHHDGPEEDDWLRAYV